MGEVDGINRTDFKSWEDAVRGREVQWWLTAAGRVADLQMIPFLMNLVS